MKNSIFVLTGLLFANTLAAATLKDLPGSIPLQYERQASSDLVYKGQIVLPDEARRLFESGEIKDLSLLNPDETSILWKNKINPAPLDDLALMQLSAYGDELEFISEDILPNGRVGFIAQKKMPSGQLKTYRLLADLKGHNLLLRKTLLRKIGYSVPLMDHLDKVRVKFKGIFSKREFAKEINRKTFVESSRWVRPESLTQEDEFLDLQDLIVFDGVDDAFYNLARGEMNEGLPQGRRLFNSVLVTSSLTDSPESVNLMSWLGGQIFNTQLYLPFEDAPNFNTSYEDARWITRRILQLSRNDWQQIVASAKVPYEVGLLLSEKLISRRNFLREVLKLTAESTELPIDLKVSSGDHLKEGKLIGNKNDEGWTGYGRHFAGIDPNSPLSKEELVGFFKSKALTNTISNLLSEFNTRYIPKTDLGLKVFDHQLDVAAKNFAESLITGKVQKTHFGFWTAPYFNSQLIAGREIVTGNYLGTENQVQIADTVGVALDAGLFALGEGLPAKMSVSGHAKMAFVRTYTHVKPLNSIKAGLKQPFKNIMVPYLKNQASGPLEKIMALEKQSKILSPEDLEKQLKSELESFSKWFGPGESLLVSTSLGPALDLRVGYNLATNVALYSQFQDKLVGMHRLHIFRKDEKTVQVYMDPATYNIFSISLGLEARIPIIKVGWSIEKGFVTTYFFDINIDPSLDTNPDFFDHIQMVQAAMRGASLEFLKSKQKPWQIQHEFSDKDRELDFLFWRHTKADTSDRIHVSHPEGKSKDYVRRLKGTRSGRDYESLLLDVTNALIEAELDSTVKVSSTHSGNPADTVYGKAVTRQVVVEAELTEKSVRFDNMIAKVNYNWKGWQIQKNDVLKILDQIKLMLGQDIFPRETLNETKKMQFYSIEVSISLYQRAFEHLLQLNESEITSIFQMYSRGPQDNDHQSWINMMISNLKKMKGALKSGDRRKVVNHLTQILEVAESQLEFDGLKALIGGEDNLFARGVIRGFRVGAENGKQEIQSRSLGQIGSAEPNGPLQSLQTKMNISGGEFFLSWLLNPL